MGDLFVDSSVAWLSMWQIVIRVTHLFYWVLELSGIVAASLLTPTRGNDLVFRLCGGCL
jgi:hypothetical protein